MVTVVNSNDSTRFSTGEGLRAGGLVGRELEEGLVLKLPLQNQHTFALGVWVSLGWLWGRGSALATL